MKGLAAGTTQESLRNYFVTYGQVAECVVKSEGNSSHGFIVYNDIRSVEKALDEPTKTINVTIFDCISITRVVFHLFSYNCTNLTTQLILIYFQGQFVKCLLGTSAKESSPSSEAEQGTVTRTTEVPSKSTKPITAGLAVPVNVESGEARKLFVRNLSTKTTTESLQAAFVQFGDVEDCTVVIDRVSLKSK